MNQNTMSRREAGLRLIALATAAGMAGGLPTGALAAQPGMGKKKDKSTAQPKPSAPAGPTGPSTPITKLLTPGRSHDWTFKVWVSVQAFQRLVPDQEPIIEIIKLATAAVVFPVNLGCATSELDLKNFKGELFFDDALADDSPKFQDGYQSGTRLGRWELVDRTGRELQLRLEMPMTCWETAFNEAAANEVPWPKSAWPAAAASTLGPDMLVDSQARSVRDLVSKWMDGKDPKSIKPVPLAKYLMSRVLEHSQPSGDGLAFNDNGSFRGVMLQKVEETASTGRGTEHDLANLMAAILRCAGLPTRTVIGYDVVDKKGQDSTALSRKRSSAKLRSWVEFCLYDDVSQKEAWIPADVVRERKSGSRAKSLDIPWKFFGNNDESEDVMPFAFQYHPPTTVVAHGNPAFWGWFTTPEIPHVEQSLRFDAQTTAKRANDPKDKRKTPG